MLQLDIGDYTNLRTNNSIIAEKSLEWGVMSTDFYSVYPLELLDG